MTPRPYVLRALDKIVTKLQNKVNRQLVNWPTGMGKTVLFANLPNALKQYILSAYTDVIPKRMMVCVDMEELVLQAADKIRLYNPELTVGVEMASCWDYGADVVVSSVATLGRKDSDRLYRFNPDDFYAVVVDECDKAVTETYNKVLTHMRVKDDIKKLLLGVTATPNRADGVGLGLWFQEIVDYISLLSGVQDGWLVDILWERVYTEADLDNLPSTYGDQEREFQESPLRNRIDTPQRNDVIVRAWLQKAKERKTAVYTAGIRHALSLASMFRAYGVSCEAIWGEDQDRRSKLSDHKRGDVQVLTNSNLLTVGYDDPEISCIVMARPLRSERLYRQIVGRGLRIEQAITGIGLKEARLQGIEITKPDCLVIDPVDNCTRLKIMSLPDLFGLPPQELAGRSVVKTVEANYLVSTAQIPSQTLAAKAERVDIFNIPQTPDSLPYSNLLWKKVERGMHILLLTKQDFAAVKWIPETRVWGIAVKCNGQVVHDGSMQFDDAIRCAEAHVLSVGGPGLVSRVSRVTAWSHLPPMAGQLRSCEWLKIKVNNTDNRGTLNEKIATALALRKSAKLRNTNREPY